MPKGSEQASVRDEEERKEKSGKSQGQLLSALKLGRVDVLIPASHLVIPMRFASRWSRIDGQFIFVQLARARHLDHRDEMSGWKIDSGLTASLSGFGVCALVEGTLSAAIFDSM
jgi:hypothetical protein